MSENLIDPKHIRIPKGKERSWKAYWKEIGAKLEEHSPAQRLFIASMLRDNQPAKNNLNEYLPESILEVWARWLYISDISIEKTLGVLLFFDMRAKEFKFPVMTVSPHENFNKYTKRDVEKLAKSFDHIAAAGSHRLKLFAHDVCWKIHAKHSTEIFAEDALLQTVREVLSDPNTYQEFSTRLNAQKFKTSSAARPDHGKLNAVAEFMRVAKNLGLPVSCSEDDPSYIAAAAFVHACGIHPDSLRKSIEQIKKRYG